MDDGDGGNGSGDWWHGGNNGGGDAFNYVLIVNLVEVKFKFLQDILHYYNNIFAFHVHMFTISILSLNKLNTTIHSNIIFMAIAYN